MRSEVDVAAAVVREAMLDWIETHWEVLAALAWRGYVTEGRGLVQLQGDWDGEVVAAYQTAATALQAGAVWPDKLVAAVQDATPATDIIFVVQHEWTATVLGMRATSTQVSPHEAGRRNGALPLAPFACGRRQDLKDVSSAVFALTICIPRWSSMSVRPTLCTPLQPKSCPHAPLFRCLNRSTGSPG